MPKEQPEYLLKVTIDVLFRASQEQITSFQLGEFDTIRKAEKLRDTLSRYNPDKLFLAKYEQITACTLSLSVSKNNTNSSQKTEQTTTSSVDSTHININPKNF